MRCCGGRGRSGRLTVVRRPHTRIRMRPGKPSVVPPVESALSGVVAEEPNADRGKHLQDGPFGGGLEVCIDRPPVGVDAPGTEQRIKDNGDDGWAITTAYSVIAALPQNRGERLVVAEQAVPQLGAGRVDLRYRPQRRDGFRAIPRGRWQVGMTEHLSKPGR